VIDGAAASRPHAPYCLLALTITDLRHPRVSAEKAQLSQP
jgi:hypothetical protein